jgi:hypothetical protein
MMIVAHARRKHQTGWVNASFLRFFAQVLNRSVVVLE